MQSRFDACSMGVLLILIVYGSFHVGGTAFHRRIVTKQFEEGSIQMNSPASLAISRPAIFAAFAGLLCAILFCSGALAQSGAGSIQGTVEDATNAVVAGATIHVLNVATGIASDTQSNGVGFYQVPALFAGNYAVTVSAPGMRTYKTSIELLVAQNAIINPILSAGAITQRVVVSGNDVQLTTTDNGAITSTLENARINQLPMNGRSLATLVGITTPGLEIINGGQNLNGMRRESLDYVIDGVTTQNTTNGGEIAPQQQLIDPDAVQEVTMEAAASDAQYSTPATVIVTTKSGTNSLHGTLFETARNNAIGLAKNRQDPSDYSAPHLVRNEFGASAGGPIILPHIYHGKNKSFWFFAYERYSQASSSAVLAKVPTLAMTQGDFSGLVNGAGLQQTIFDPATTANSAKCPYTQAANPYCRTAFPNNQIPTAEESPLAKIYYDLIPKPTSPANPLVQANLDVINPSFQVEPQETFRLDHMFNESNRAYLRYTQNVMGVNVFGGPRNLAVDGIPAGAAVGSSGSGSYHNAPTATYLASVDYAHVFSPTFFAETNFSQQWLNSTATAGVAPNVNYESRLGLPNNFGESGFPLFSGPLFALGTSQTGHNEISQIVITLDENLTKTVGHHQMQFGGRYRHERMFNVVNALNDAISITGAPTALYQTSSGANYSAIPNTGYADASLFLGSANAYTVNLSPPGLHFHLMEFDSYMQDNYHARRDLTVTLGLRYENHTGYWVKNGLLSSFDLKNDAEVLGAPITSLIAEGFTTQAIISNDENIGVKFETPQQAGVPAKLFKNYNLLFLPRIGFAYQPFGGRHGTVIRGGYGRYVAATNANEDGFSESIKVTPIVGTYTQSYSSAAQAIDGLPNELLRYNDPAVFGVMGVNTANVVNTSSTNAILPGLGHVAVSPNWPPASDTETDFTIEQSLKGNSALRISWIWTHGTNLPANVYYNHHPTNYQWEMATGTIPPTGGAAVIGTSQQNTYAATATGPYDQTTWGNNTLAEKVGWSNDNALQVNYQRLFHHGVAYQFTYVFSRPLQTGTNVWPTFSPALYPAANFPGVMGSVGTMSSPYGTVYPGVPPPARPAGVPVWGRYHALDRYEYYGQDSTVPIHHIRFNGIVDLPFGRGKRFLGNVSGFVNELVGGFQLAGDGSITSQVFAPSAGNWGAVSPLKVYKHKKPITDCRSGVCQKEYLWFNGYLAPTVTTGVAGSTCTKNCVTGLPADYVPMQVPINNTPGTPYYGTNDVLVSSPAILAANKGAPVAIAYDAGPIGANYLGKSWVNGPMNWVADASLFKVFPIREGTSLRFNMDAFNVFNVQGYTNPGPDGTEKVEPGGLSNSYNAPRQIQLTMRLTF